MVTRSNALGIAGGLLSLLALAACSSPTPASPAAASTSAAPSAPATSAPATAAPTVALAETSLGKVLVDGKGMTLYLFTKDTPNKSVCEGQCLANWLALVGKAVAGDGVDASKLGTLTRSDGTIQASYGGWPLYYWVKDAKPGDVTGQNVQGVWYVIGTDGQAIKG